jgi:hypothetical protein
MKGLRSYDPTGRAYRISLMAARKSICFDIGEEIDLARMALIARLPDRRNGESITEVQPRLFGSELVFATKPEHSAMRLQLSRDSSTRT